MSVSGDKVTCTCGAQPADQGDLEVHILDMGDGHEPVDPQYHTELTKEHVRKVKEDKVVRDMISELGDGDLRKIVIQHQTLIAEISAAMHELAEEFYTHVQQKHHEHKETK